MQFEKILETLRITDSNELGITHPAIQGDGLDHEYAGRVYSLFENPAFTEEIRFTLAALASIMVKTETQEDFNAMRKAYDTIEAFYTRIRNIHDLVVDEKVIPEEEALDDEEF